MSHFADLLKLDMCHGGLRAVPKLTATHVEPNNFQPMNVRLAVQVGLSHMFIFVLRIGEWWQDKIILVS